MIVGSVVCFLHLGICQSFFLFQKLTKTEPTWRVIIQLPSQVFHAKLLPGKNKIITKMHSGFRKRSITTDQLIHLDTFDRVALIQKQHAVAVFFDLEKVYNSTCNMELRKICSMQVLEDDYLSLFRASYRIDNSAWDLVTTNLICLIRRWVLHKAASRQLLCLYLRLTLLLKIFTRAWSVLSRYMHIIESHLQQTFSKLQTWVHTNGFKFSESTTVCVHFYKLRTVNPDPTLLLNGTPIAVVEQVKFFGLIFEKQLSFILHSIVKNVTPGVECSLHVDDFIICCRSICMHIIESRLLQTLNKLQTLVDLTTTFV